MKVYDVKVPVDRVPLNVLRCPICDVIYHSEASRKIHETSKHSNLLETLCKPTCPAPPTKNSVCSQQPINQLAKRPHLLKSFKALGKQNKGSFKCSFCK